MTALESLLRAMTFEGALYEKLPDNKVRCFACAHRCQIADGRPGVCRVRFNERGKLRVPAGYAAGLQIDPIEKKPFYHVMPGAQALSFGMLGCDFHCPFCQNWISSQTLRDPAAIAEPERVSAEEMVAFARRRGAQIATSTYNEPLITSEWSVEVFKLARQAGMATGYVSNGNGTPEVLDYLRPWLDFYKADLKGFSPAGYRQLGGKLEHVLETIAGLYARGFWVEIVTLVVPGFNDSESELRDIARFIKSVSPDIPWHTTAFHSDYRMDNGRYTSARQIMRAVEIGYEEGLHYVYAGNRPGDVGELENTRCHQCRTLLVEREGFSVLQNNIQAGCCPKCATRTPGVWSLDDVKTARECRHREVAKLDIAALVTNAGRKRSGLEARPT
ncbi:MAG: AmmeMemoRadiSam system radical SAM enzyme [Verrucomicrobia bacterium]|nr:AmmeMemoRadiSam system radical SAM enzyme [Verrucomicrobiota bacterium]